MTRAPAPPTSRGPALRTYGVGRVARWLSITPAYLTKLMERYPPYPAPDATIEPGRRGKPDEGWTETTRPEWAAWKAHLPGHGTPGRPPKQPAATPPPSRTPGRPAPGTAAP
jgi:hypothetical protein